MTVWSYVADLWCTLMHPAPMWPSHGYYRCRACGREYPVPWEEPGQRKSSIDSPAGAVLVKSYVSPAGTIPVVTMR